MIATDWLREDEVLAIRPTGKIGRDDFAAIGAMIDPVIARKGRLEGLLVDTRGFSGWEDVNALIEHLRFAGRHQPGVARIAAVGEHWWLAALPAMEVFIGAPVRVFGGDDEDAARAWLLESPPEPPAMTILPEEDRIVAVKVQGRLRHDDYAMLRRELERRTAGDARVRLLAILDDGFRGWTPRAALDDLAMAFSPWSRRLERVAVVSGPGFVSWFVRNFPEALVPYQLRAFERDEVDAAREWLRR